MRRIGFAALLALFLVPATVEAQIPRFMAGVGVSTPTGDFGDVADVGFHGRLGLQLGAPGVPISGRLEGGYTSFGQAEPAPKISVLDGSLSAVLTLEGPMLQPYFLVGAGLHRVDSDLEGAEATTEPGFHGGFGVNIGALGFGGFAELRVVQINTEGVKSRYFPITIGIRL